MSVGHLEETLADWCLSGLGLSKELTNRTADRGRQTFLWPSIRLEHDRSVVTRGRIALQIDRTAGS